MNYTIRKILPHEYGRLHVLMLEFANFISSSDSVTNTSAQLETDKDQYECLMVEENDKVIGYAIYYFAYSSWSGKVLYLEDLYLQPLNRNRGIGKALFASLIEIAKSTSCKKMKWQVSSWNEKAKSFYTSLGADIDNTEINCQKNILDK